MDLRKESETNALERVSGPPLALAWIPQAPH